MRGPHRNAAFTGETAGQATDERSIGERSDGEQSDGERSDGERSEGDGSDGEVPIREEGRRSADVVEPLSVRREVQIFAAMAALCPVVAYLDPGSPAEAIDRTHRLLAFERSLGLDIEASAHAWLLGRPGLFRIAEVLYLGLHVSALVGVFLWLAARHPDRFRRVRTVFVCSHLLTIAAYLRWPTAPPRLAGAPSDRSMTGDTLTVLQYEFAAMPSGHVVFALVVALGLSGAGSVWWRRAGWLYPPFVIALVVVTGHHLLIDAVGAVVVVATALVVALVVERVLARSFVRNEIRPFGSRMASRTRSRPSRPCWRAASITSSSGNRSTRNAST